MGWRLKVGATVTTVVALFAGYLVADAFDVVPGMVTFSPPPEPPAPFPSAPGAGQGPAPQGALEALDGISPTATEISALVDDLADDSRLGDRVGVLVADADDGRVLGDAGADRRLVPASTQKILTAVAAYDGPGKDLTLPTRVVIQRPGHLVLVGGGDMMLSADASDPVAVNGRAGLGDLADQVVAELALTGTESVTLALDDTLFTGPEVAPSVPPRWAEQGYVAPVSALAVDVARLRDEEYAERSSDPSMAAARIFAERLEERGVTVTGNVSRETSAATAREIGRVDSAPLGEIVADFLRRSDNTTTELVGRVVALHAGLPGSLDAAITEVTASVERRGVDLSDAELADLSGLGEGSLMTARQLVDVLEVAARHPELREAVTGLPVAGLQGTLATRYPDSNPGRGYTSAKTGSLPGVRGLAGTVVTADDRLLLFAVLADDIPDDQTWGAPLVIDGFVGQLAACGCTAADEQVATVGG